MAYKLWLPGDPEPGTEEFERRGPATPTNKSAATEGPSRPCDEYEAAWHIGAAMIAAINGR